MPTPEEIKNLAHEYGVLMAKDIPMSNCLKNEVVSSTEDYIVQFMSWLTKDYCIVPKSQLKELYDCYRQHEQTCKVKGLHNATLIAIGSQATMRDIFGKSLFEEEK